MLPVARLAVQRPVAIVVTAVALTLLGVIAWQRLPVDLLPDIQSPTIVVSVRSGDRPPTEMERIYGEQVEQRLFTVRGIRDVVQVARTGRLITSVTFDWGVDMDLALVDVQKVISPLSGDPDVDEAIVRRFDPRQSPVLTAGLVSKEQRIDLAALRQVARRQIAPALERLEGVAEVRVVGGREPEMRVEVEYGRLVEFGITLDVLEGRLQAANLDISAGTLEEGERVFLVRGLSRFRSVRDIENVVVLYSTGGTGNLQPIRVRDVGRVVEATRDITHLVRVNGDEGVGLQIFKEAGANTVGVAREIRWGLGELEKDLRGVEFIQVADESSLVEQAIGDVRSAAIVGALLAIAVLVLFLRSLSPTVVIAASVPVSLLATVFLMSFSGNSLNVMTLAGLALGAGLLIDNAIVVLEAIYRKIESGMTVAQASIAGAGEVSGAIVASTLTTCVVFLPVLFLKGLAARLVSGMAFTVVASLLVSMIVAMALVPALSTWLVSGAKSKSVEPRRGAIVGLVERVLRRPLLVVLAATVAFAAAVSGLTTLGTELLPPSDPRQIGVRLVGPPGARVEATDRTASVIEGLVRQSADGGVAASLAEVGRIPEDDRFIRAEQTEENTARLVFRLSEDAPSAASIVGAVSRAVDEVPRVEAEWSVGASALARALGTTRAPIVVQVSGNSLEDLRRGADRVVERISGVEGLWNVRSSLEGGPPELRIVLDRTIADGLGVDLESVARTLEVALDGRVATLVAKGDEEWDVTIRGPSVRLDTLSDVPLLLPSGVRINLGDVARFEDFQGAREIHRRNQRRMAEVTARVAQGTELPKARSAVLSALGGLDMPPGIRIELAGDEPERRRAFNELRSALLLASVLVFMVLAGKFESLIHPLTVISSLPMASIGVALVLVPAGDPIGVMAMLGLVMLAGIAVNDSILLVDAIEQMRASGLGRREAIAAGVSIRLRPVLMTTATTVLALVPLALAGGDASELRAPLAWTVIGGVLASTVASIFVTPCVYDLLDRLSLRKRGEAAVERA